MKNMKSFLSEMGVLLPKGKVLYREHFYNSLERINEDFKYQSVALENFVPWAACLAF